MFSRYYFHHCNKNIFRKIPGKYGCTFAVCIFANTAHTHKACGHNDWDSYFWPRQHLWGRGEACTGFWLGNLRERDRWGNPSLRWEDNIKLDLQEMGCGCMDWIDLAQDRDRWRAVVNAVMNFRVPWNAGNYLTGCKPVSFSRRTLLHGVNKWVS